MRYKEFNRNAVLEKSIPLFWKNSFTGTPISAVVKATNVNRFSLYNEFENKEGILLASIDLYLERYAQQRLAILEQEGEVSQILFQYLSSYLNENDKHPPGDYIIYIGTELADHDKSISEKLNSYIESIEQKLSTLLEREDEWATKKDFYARQLCGLFCSSVSFCVIHSPEERVAYIKRGISVILDTEINHGTYA
jgi:TetR/AcrR family transcriptional regulator, transcriptional repressor for nem operon